ncbi:MULTISPECIES: transposase [unclassified Bradyrhizobium]
MICSLIRKQLSKRGERVRFCPVLSGEGGGPLPRSFGLWRRVWRPGASVVEVARRRDVQRNLVTAWRRQARTGVLACVAGPRQDDEVRLRQSPLRQTGNR